MPANDNARVLFTVRPGLGGINMVTDKARQALAYVDELAQRGLRDVHVLDACGQRVDLAELARLAAAEQGAPPLV